MTSDELLISLEGPIIKHYSIRILQLQYVQTMLQATTINHQTGHDSPIFGLIFQEHFLIKFYDLKCCITVFINPYSNGTIRKSIWYLEMIITPTKMIV